MDIENELIVALPRLRAFARSRAVSSSDADDLVQRACLKILDRQNDLHGVEILPYTITVIRNLSIDDFRSQKKRRSETELSEIDNLSNDNSIREKSDLSMRATEGLAIINEITRYIHKLPEYCKEVLVMLGSGHSYDEIAKILGVERSTIGTRTLRCRKQLKVLMSGSASS